MITALMLVAVESPTGGGKGFLLKYLQHRCLRDVTVMLLDDNISNMLDFQNDPARWGLFTQLSILEAHAEMQALSPDGMCLTEGSHLTDRACHFSGLHVLLDEQRVYHEVYDALQLRDPDIIVYLKTDVHACFERIISNSKREQVTYSLDRCAAEVAAYDQFMADCSIPVVEIVCPPFFEDCDPLLNQLADDLLHGVREMVIRANSDATRPRLQ